MLHSSLAVAATAALLHIPGAKASSLGDFLQSPYGSNATIPEQLQCYALPYGGWGFASHMLTYYTVLCLVKRRRPLSPWKDLKATGRRTMWNFSISFTSLASVITSTVFTMIRCRNSWQFILIAVWKLILSLTLSAMTAHAAWAVNRNSRGGDMYRPVNEMQKDSTTRQGALVEILVWTVPYFMSAIVGSVGLMDLVRQYLQDSRMLQTITYIFVGLSCGGTLTVMIVTLIATWTGANFLRSLGLSALAAVEFGLLILTVLFALYSDWALGAISGDLAGYPTQSNAWLYWLYWTVKRLPMLSV